MRYITLDSSNIALLIIDPKDGIKEQQELVISTISLPLDDWIKTRLFASISELFYFNKVLANSNCFFASST